MPTIWVQSLNLGNSDPTSLNKLNKLFKKEKPELDLNKLKFEIKSIS